jgi:hypothetical protein
MSPPTRYQRARFPRCTSLAPVVVHLSTLRSRRQNPFTHGDNSRVVTKCRPIDQVVVSFGAHGSRSFREHLKLQLPPRRRLADALLATAQEANCSSEVSGRWRSITYLWLAKSFQPLQPDSRTTARKAAALPVDPTGVAGWRRFTMPQSQLCLQPRNRCWSSLQPTPSVGASGRRSSRATTARGEGTSARGTAVSLIMVSGQATVSQDRGR